MTPGGVSVVIPTRDRPAQVVEAVRALLAGDGPDCEVIVVDQSLDDRTALAVSEMDERVRRVPCEPRGAAAARNTGIAHARGEIIGLTDDDCEVPPDWLDELVRAFAVDPAIGVVFGNVEPGPHDSGVGFVPGYVRERPVLARRVFEQDRADGTSACMGVRRSVWEQLSGFDEMLGVGAPLKGASEGDFALRALAAGHLVYETPRWRAVHHGFFRWDERPGLIHRYWYGTGAMVAKPLKRGDWTLAPLLLRLGWRWAFTRSPVTVSLGNQAHRWLRLRAFVQGFTAGALTPLDATARHYSRAGR